MTAIDSLLHQPAAQAVGWALLHFVWQGALIGALAAVALAVLRRSAPDVRYVVSAIALSLMLTMPVVTAVQSWRGAVLAAQVPAADPTRSNTPARSSTPDLSVTLGPVAGAPSNDRQKSSRLDSIRVEPWLPILVLGWCCGVGVLALRLLSGWLWVQRMKTHGTHPAAHTCQAMATRLSRRLHIRRRVQLLQSTLVDVPTVIGWIKPVVLLPASALAGLTPQQLEAILAHELAHIRRHDYLVNLLQTLVETLLFYHPAVWWLSRRIRIERENCCDDLAVSLCGDPYTYAQALADLEELRGSGHQLVLAANGGSLLQRVRRLLGAPTHAGRAPGWLAGSVAIVLMLGLAAGATGTDAFQADQATTPAIAPTRPVARAEPEAVVQAGQPTEQALVAAAAERKHRKAEIYALAARAASRVQEATGQATTPVIAGQTLAAQADAFRDAAVSMAAQAALVETSETASTARHASSSQNDVMSAAAAASTHAPSVGLAIGGAQSHGTFSWSNNGEKLEVKYVGEIEFTEDDTDLKRLSPGGSLRIKDGGWFAGRTVEFTADSSGAITRRYWVGMSEKPFDPEGRQWLAKMLPRFIRQTGLGAPARVARILKAKGPAGVLAEIALIDGSWGKRLYFKELLKTPSLGAATLRQLVVQAGREIDSDFELASLLIDGAGTLLADEGTRQAYFDAARSIDSDFEMRRVYSSALKRSPVSSPVLAGILDASRIESDFEQATLLVQIAKLQPLDSTTRTPFFNALATVDSDFEHRRVLSVLAERTDLGPETTTAMLGSVAALQSDFEAATFLLQIAKQQPIEGGLRAPFFKAVESVESAFESGRVLKAVVERPDASKETVLGALRATRGMSSSHETSQVLLAVASTHPLSGEARDAFIVAAEKLSDHEQGRVLAALVRNERNRR